MTLWSMEALDAAAPLPRRLWVRLATAMPFLRRIDTSFSQGHKSVVSSLRWGTLADGSGVVFSGSYDKTAKAWDERTGEAIFTHDAEANNASGFGGGGGGAVTAVELSSCGRWCFVAQRHDVSMLELPSGEVRHIVPMCEEGSEVKWIAASPDGKWLAVCVINNAAPALAIISLPGDVRVPAAAVRVDAVRAEQGSEAGCIQALGSPKQGRPPRPGLVHVDPADPEIKTIRCRGLPDNVEGTANLTSF